MANCPGLLELVILLASITPDYLLEEDKSTNEIQITARNDGTSGLCVLTQNEKISIRLEFLLGKLKANLIRVLR